MPRNTPYSDDELLTAFWAKVDRSRGADGCWPWMASRDRFGYGSVGIRHRTMPAHRFAYTVEVAPIPAGLFVLHRCDNPPCCNPAHLFLGTRGDNNRDRVAKGRGHIGENHPTHKLTADDVRQIRQMYAGGGISQRQIATRFDVGQNLISKIVRRAAWKSVA